MSTGSRLVADIVMNFWNFEDAALQFFLNDGAMLRWLVSRALHNQRLMPFRQEEPAEPHRVKMTSRQV